MLTPFLLAALLALAAPAAADGAFSTCSTAPNASAARPPTDTLIRRPGEKLCWDFDNDSGSNDSTIISIATETALFCLDPDDGGTGTATAQVVIRRCLRGTKPGSSPNNECLDVTGTALDGTEGDSTTQNACQRVGPGQYYIDTTTGPGAGEDARVEVTGE